MASGAAEAVVVEVDGRAVRLTNLSKQLFPDGTTKREMVDYYRAIAPALLPHLEARPLTMRRFPEGVGGNTWFQTECRGQPPWVSTLDVRFKTGNVQRMCAVDDLPSLLWVANQGTIELHPYLGRREDLERPLLLVFDLDPGAGATSIDCCAVALRLRAFLEDLRLACFVKTSGSKGVHVTVPLNGTETYDGTKPFARAIAAVLARERPDRVTATMAKAERVGKVLIDWSQNDAGKSTVAPYSLRAGTSPAVAAPLLWEEIEHAVATGDGSSLVVRPADALARVERLGDLFDAVLRIRQPLPRLAA